MFLPGTFSNQQPTIIFINTIISVYLQISLFTIVHPTTFTLLSILAKQPCIPLPTYSTYHPFLQSLANHFLSLLFQPICPSTTNYIWPFLFSSLNWFFAFFHPPRNFLIRLFIFYCKVIGGSSVCRGSFVASSQYCIRDIRHLLYWTVVLLISTSSRISCQIQLCKNCKMWRSLHTTLAISKPPVRPPRFDLRPVQKLEPTSTVLQNV